MRQAIETKYLGPTNHRGARIKATAQAGSVMLSWDDSKDVDENHLDAAQALAKKFGWYHHKPGKWVGGGNAKGTGNVYVWVEPWGVKKSSNAENEGRVGETV